jgi:hypothetical protein
MASFSAWRRSGIERSGQEDLKRQTNSLEGTEGNETITGSDIKQRHAGAQFGPVEDTVADRLDRSVNDGPVRWITAMTAIQEPLRPDIGWRRE